MNITATNKITLSKFWWFNERVCVIRNVLSLSLSELYIETANGFLKLALVDGKTTPEVQTWHILHWLVSHTGEPNIL
jgi:hypothetical protein